MGEVYRAKDTRLDREVAIKLLPPNLGGDEQFRARFEREAKSVSSLNHPHICTLHDIGQETVKGETLHYLVLEMIEGESLASRLSKGPLSLEDTLKYGNQIASALDAAHKRGIVHRDLKPGNVMITKAGAKLLDFGLAKVSERGVIEGLSQIETINKEISEPLTQAGTIMGTFQYMAPEQLEGSAADARTDIFALGAVLYEMATGKKAFEGKNRTSLIAAIVSSQPPPISAVHGMSPPALDHIVRKCLEKDPDDRWQSARDVAAELKWIAEGGSRAGIPAALSSRRRTRESAAWSAAALLGLTAIGFAVAWARRTPEVASTVRFTFANPQGAIDVGPPAVSPDGRTVAFDAADASGVRQIWIRPLDTLEARPLPGTEGAVRPIWSPDSRWIAFVGGGKLRKVAISGGPPQSICDAPTGADGSWNKDGVILFDGTDNDPIWRVDAAGGAPKVEVESSKEGAVGWPAFLPDGRHFLYMSGVGSDTSKLMVRALGAKEGVEVLRTASKVAYAAPGYLLFIRDQTLVAQPFDAAKQKITGEPIPIGEGLGINNVGGASFSISDNRVLAFRSGEQQGRRLIWLDRNGKESPAMAELRTYTDFSVSPDGKRLAFDETDTSGKGDLWIRDLSRGVTTRFTFEKERDFAPQWSPDGRKIVYSREGKKARDLYLKDASGTGEAELLFESDENKFVTHWTQDGAYVIFARLGKDAGWDIWAMPMKGDRTPIPLVKTQFSEHGGVVSPDGKFLAYRSNESGRTEVYVQEFPEARSKFQVSTNGGSDPFWKGDGREIYYRTRDRKIVAVPVQPGASFNVGPPETLFETTFATVTARGLFRPTPDGQRFLVVAPLGREAIPPTTVVVNWSAATR